jgi:DNA mismatch endonuclease (patch repair protein)
MLRRRADIVFSRLKIAVFIDGCFWHGCPEHFRMPRANHQYWSTKIGRNRQRDVDTTTRLQEAGWSVLRFWEHEPIDQIVESVTIAVNQQRALDVRGG